MRKILLLILCCFTMCVIAQETKHLEFKGVPMEGNVFSFADKLVEKGFKWEEPLEGYIFMTGRFMEREVGVLIMGTSKTNTIWKIVVITDEEFTTWYRLKSKYTEYTRLFTKKYGMPTAHFEFFSSPYYEGDGYELQGFRENKGNYASFYESSKGTITVQINNKCHIEFNYEDKINVEIMQKEKEDKILDDI